CAVTPPPVRVSSEPSTACTTQVYEMDVESPSNQVFSAGLQVVGHLIGPSGSATAAEPYAVIKAATKVVTRIPASLCLRAVIENCLSKVGSQRFEESDVLPSDQCINT